jgi:hypothetical protein
LNLYSYCVNNPIRYWDPTGHVRILIPDGNGGYIENEGYINKEGETYYEKSSLGGSTQEARIPIGTYVETNAGWYQLGDDGVGVKVDGPPTGSTPSTNPAKDSNDLAKYAGPATAYADITSLTSLYGNDLKDMIDKLSYHLTDKEIIDYMMIYNDSSYTTEQKLRVLFSILSGTDINYYMSMQNEEARQIALTQRAIELYNAGMTDQLHYFLMIPFFNETQMSRNVIATENGPYWEGWSYGYGGMFGYAAAQNIPLYQLCPTAEDREIFFAGYGMGAGYASGMDALAVGSFMNAAARSAATRLAAAGVTADVIEEITVILGRAGYPATDIANILKAFGVDIRVTTLTQDTVVYRYCSGPSEAVGSDIVGRWFTPNQVANPVSDLALPSHNTAQYMETVTLPAGTRIIEGTVARNFGQNGGGYQYYVLP